MTNAEKFLKNPDDYHDLACKIAIHMSNSIKKGTVQNIDDFFKKQEKPVLSEDEKVILRRIDNKYQIIGRCKQLECCRNNLFIQNILFENEHEWSSLDCYNDLFQFIKPRRRI